MVIKELKKNRIRQDRESDIRLMDILEIKEKIDKRNKILFVYLALLIFSIGLLTAVFFSQTPPTYSSPNPPNPLTSPPFSKYPANSEELSRAFFKKVPVFCKKNNKTYLLSPERDRFYPGKDIFVKIINSDSLEVEIFRAKDCFLID